MTFQAKNPRIPILILTGLDDKKVAIKAVRAGAQDYLLKVNLEGRLLTQSIRYAIERKYIEWQLRLERDKTQKYLDVAAVILLVINNQEEVEMINHMGCQVLGYKEEKIVGKNWFDNFLPNPEREKFRSSFRKMVNGKSDLIEYYENTMITRSGEKRLIAWKNTVLKDDADRIISTLSSGEDITERKRAEQTLRTQYCLNKLKVDVLKDISENKVKPGKGHIRRFLSKVGQSMDLPKSAYFELDPEKKEYTLNQQSGKRSKPISVAESISYDKIKHIICCPHVRFPDAEAPATKISDFKELKYFCPSKESKEKISSILIIPDGEDDIPKGIFVFLKSDSDNRFTKSYGQLLTDLVHTLLLEEAKLNAEREVSKLASVVEQASESIMITDLGGYIEYVNPMFEKITGYAKEEVIGKNPRILKYQTQGNDFYKMMWETIKSGKTWKGTLINRKKDGSAYHEEAVIFPIKDKENRIIKYAAVKSDVTDGKKLEAQLRQMQKLEALGQLAGGIAHDFNNILSVINGFSELALLAMNSRDPVYNKLKQIAHAGKKANSLVRQLLAFSRRQNIKPELINVNLLIKEIEKMILRLIGEDIVINFNLSKNPVRVKADRGQIEQVLINLIVNARDAINERTDRASEKCITIETQNAYLDECYISQHPGSKEGWHTQIIVSDTGIGMCENTKLKIFEPFFTTKLEGKGTGLGLATVYGIIKQNDGSIYVHSELEKGTSFVINWPKSLEKSSGKVRKRHNLKIVGGEETILVAEDEADVRKFACEALDTLGYNVIPAENGKQALSLIKANQSRVNLLLSDVIMPEMGGGELVERLSDLFPDLKVILATGYTESHINSVKIFTNKLNFIHKPYTVRNLAEKIREVLDKN
jgi:PAS domain S-box-containing protein